MTIKLLMQAITKFVLGVLLVGLLIFLPAGTLLFFNGWLLMSILFVPMLFAGIVMMVKNPDLLKSRLQAKEKQREQSIVVKISGLMFFAGFVVAGLNFRFGWFMLPKGVVIGAAVVFLAAYVLYAEVLRENTYLSRTIEVQKTKKLLIRGCTALSDIPCTAQRSYCFYPCRSCWALYFHLSYFLPIPLSLSND